MPKAMELSYFSTDTLFLQDFVVEMTYSIDQKCLAPKNLQAELFYVKKKKKKPVLKLITQGFTCFRSYLNTRPAINDGERG